MLKKINDISTSVSKMAQLENGHTTGKG